MEKGPVSESRRVEINRLLDRLELPYPSQEQYEILHLALIHRSYSVEQDTDDNERLEFLGDSVINLVTAEFLYETRPEDPEGDLSKMRATMVSRKILGKVAKELEIGELLLLGVGEEGSGGRTRMTTLGSALEALSGALYHVYEWPQLRKALRDHVIAAALRANDSQVLVDCKSQLQEWAQKHFQLVPEYQTVSSAGPDHQKEFIVEVLISGEKVAQGHGGRKKWAENEAARSALEMIEDGWTPGRTGENINRHPDYKI